MAAVSDELAIPAGPRTWRRLERAGEGASSVVWRAEHASTGRVVALKVAKPGTENEAAVAREVALLVRVGRRWGPDVVDAGPGFVAIDWVAGNALEPKDIEGDRERVAVEVAHSVGRALEELHDAGTFHGDVKPANVMLRGRPSSRDACDDRAATLIDLGLAGDASDGPFGVTPRYAAPELRERGEGGQPADLWALGVLLAEILDPQIARRDELPPVLVTEERASASELWRWVQALLAPAPGARPSAGWLATRASRLLQLAPEAIEASCARVERVRRSYLKERAREIGPRVEISPAIGWLARDWLGTAIAWATKLNPQANASAAPLEPLEPVRKARWLVTLVGPSAAHWSMAANGDGDDDWTSRAVELARTHDPASWTLEDLTGQGEPVGLAPYPESEDPALGLMRDLGRQAPPAHTLALAEDVVSRPGAPRTLALQLAGSLARRGEVGRAWVALAGVSGGEADALKAELARRRGDLAQARASAERALASTAEGPPRWSAQATLARIAWDAGDIDVARTMLEGARGPAAAELHALIDWRQGASERGLVAVGHALSEPLGADAEARLEGARGMLELARGASEAALDAFGRAVELATRAGAVVEEATYLTNDAAAASDAGQLARCLTSATRAALLWERLGRPERAARAWLARAAALATLGATHLTDEAAEEARARAAEAGDPLTSAYALWARVEVRAPGDAQARAWALEAAERVRGGSGVSDELRAAARLLVWAPGAIDAAEIATRDGVAASAPPPARWEWWGARAHAAGTGGRREAQDRTILAALLSLVDVPAPLGSRGPALFAAVRLAVEVGDGEAARRFEVARVAAARVLSSGTPKELRPSLGSVSWAKASDLQGDEVAFPPAQVAALEVIIRSLSSRERLRPLLEQVLDTMVMWTGVERGLLLLRAPDDRLVPRAARNLARRDLVGAQVTLSQTIARRAIETGDAVVATDAVSTFSDLHASVHALRLRSVLAVPLMARGETLGVVYLDDRVRKGAFGPQELAWVRVVASQAAMAIADARDAVLLRRAARRAERAKLRLEKILGEREVELDAVRTELELQQGRETRYRYDAIAGRSEPMRDLLRLVDRVTASDVPVLLIGESGTGKELVARAVHGNGPRARRAFVSENCASVPEPLLESALFGHIKGAFTGASATRAGLFDVANGGTLLLDEIGEMSLSMQAKLLRVLQDGEVRPVGGDRLHHVDVRVIGATHRDLTAMVRAGTFREDLFYRLNVITLRIPPLRERAEDMPLLVEHFLKKHAPDRTLKVTRAAISKLSSFSWPGNVRQLENELRRAIVLTDGTIDLADLSEVVRREGQPASTAGRLDMRGRVDSLETELLVEALTKTRGNQTRAAQLLGLSRFGLQKMMKRLGVQSAEGAWHGSKGRA